MTLADLLKSGELEPSVKKEDDLDFGELLDRRDEEALRKQALKQEK